MNKQQIAGLIAAGLVFAFVGAISALTSLYTSSMDFSGFDTGVYPRSGEYVGVVKVKGIIQDTGGGSFFDVPEYNHQRTLDSIDEMMNASNNRGILLYVDTPGGGVFESEELYLKLSEYRSETERPIYVYMDKMAASGGYYIAMASDKQVYANRNTITASIGVVLSYMSLHELFESLGIEDVRITSGEHKDIMSSGKKVNDADNAILQSMIDEYFDRFAEVVAAGRGMSDSDVRKIADGRIMTAKQAYEADLIDGVKTYEEVKELIHGDLGENISIYEPTTTGDFWSSLLSVSNNRTKSDAQALIEYYEKSGNGAFMYYVQLPR
jgi:protease-4